MANFSRTGGDGEFYQAESLSHLPTQNELEKMQNFVKDHAAQLQDFENALEETISDAWDFATDPVALDIQPYEQVPLVDLIHTDNKFFNKIIMAFAALCDEASEMERHARETFYNPLSIFGELAVDQNPTDGDAETHLGKCFPLLKRLNDFVGHLGRLVRNFVQQIASLYTAKGPEYTATFKKVHMPRVYEALGSVLAIYVTLDELIMQNRSISNSWNSYKQMLFVINRNPANFNVQEDSLRSVEQLMREYERTLLGDNATGGVLLENAINQDFEVPGVVVVRGNKVFLSDLNLGTRNRFEALMKSMGTSLETDGQLHLIGVLGLYVFHRRLSAPEKPDKKFYQEIWAAQKKVPMVHLCGGAVWSIAEFINRHASMSCSVSPSNIKKHRIQCVKNSDDSLMSDVQLLYLRVCAWMVRMESNLTSRQETHEILASRAVHLLNGLVLAYQCGNLLKQSLILHVTHPDISVRMSNIVGLSQCAEMIKAIQFTFHRKSLMIGESLPHLLRHAASRIQTIAGAAKQRFEERAKFNDPSTFDRLAAMTLIHRVLEGTITPQRVMILKIAMSIARLDSILREPELEDLRTTSWKLEHLCVLGDELNRVCDCSFMYWSRELNDAYFDKVFQHPERGHKLQYLVAALQDNARLLTCAQHQNAEDLVMGYRSQLERSLQDRIISPLCEEVENDLRMHIHITNSVQQMINPVKIQGGIRELARIFTLRPIRLFDKVIDLRTRVAHYLDQTFYNLNTVAPHDWKTYTEMRNLAAEKYGLELTDVHLPSATLEQGLDMLEIMKMIAKFVQMYNYNLNNQNFIERHAEKHKHLNTISIRHIANSIRTHGSGVQGTTVTYVYQFLARKIGIFSQFLYDDHIKSVLLQDIRFFAKQEDKHYPYERAKKFNKDIWKLGKAPGGMSYLDKFRVLITEIGNALGFVRMVRSGGLQYLSGAIKFVPDLTDILNFEKECQEDKLSEDTTTAAKNLDAAIDHLLQNFAEGSDYIKMLVQVFAGHINGDGHDHLQNFYVSIPPLCVNFVDHISGMKERLSASGKLGSKATCFTDDGFAMGVAFITRVLDQWKRFDSLHWFESVAQFHKRTADELSAEMKNTKKKRGGTTQEEFQHRMKLNQSRLKEFELLNFSINSARVFFIPRVNETSEDDAQEAQSQTPADSDAANATATMQDVPQQGQLGE